MVFILSDLFTGDFEQPLRALAGKHEVVLLHITDPLERALPKLPALSVEDLETGEVVRISGRRAKSLEAAAAERTQQINTLCNRAGVDFVSIDTATDYVPKPIELFTRRMARRR